MSDERATRRRGAELVAAIREATLAELTEHGYAGVTFEGVGRRAQTSKSVLYRRYSSRPQMIIDAWTSLAPLELPRQSTGFLRDDLVGILLSINVRFQRIGTDAFRRVIAEADDELLETVTSFAWEHAREALEILLNAARSRGELGDAPIDDRAVILPLVLLRHELFFTRGVVDEATIAEMVDQICVPLLTARASTP